jgi:dUTP pyrophosphatase
MDNKEILNQINKKYEDLMKEAEVSIDEDYFNIPEIFNGELDELYNEIEMLYKSKKIYVERIHPDAILPTYAYPSDSGFDLCSVEKIIIPPSGRVAIPTGLKFQFDENHELQIRPKSGLALNMGLTILNSPGTVDHGYTGEIKVIVFNANNQHIIIEKGMKIGQAVLCPVINGKYVTFEEVESLNDKDRGDNGFGSTGIGI